jgi:8-oxo-dGTP pyrophosphatase MutT (NUDIX family)
MGTPTVERFYYHDPHAPVPNRPVSPGASAVIFDGDHRILALKRSRSDYWSLPGGRVDMNESAQDCCVRETLEETGLVIRVIRVISVNSDPHSIAHYPDGNVHRSFFICFEAEILGGELRTSIESEEFRWVTRQDIDMVKLIPDSRINMIDAWDGGTAAVIR